VPDALAFHFSGAFRFDRNAGVLSAGHNQLGVVPLGSKKRYFLADFAEQLDLVVPYAGMKHYVRSHAGNNG
jgi:hypothetical protein